MPSGGRRSGAGRPRTMPRTLARMLLEIGDAYMRGIAGDMEGTMPEEEAWARFLKQTRIAAMLNFQVDASQAVSVAIALLHRVAIERSAEDVRLESEKPSVSLLLQALDEREEMEEESSRELPPGDELEQVQGEQEHQDLPEHLPERALPALPSCPPLPTQHKLAGLDTYSEESGEGIAPAIETDKLNGKRHPGAGLPGRSPAHHVMNLTLPRVKP